MNLGNVETTELRAKIGHCRTREYSGLRKGEWICAECAAKNYSARISCYRCSLGKWESEIRSKGKAAFDWECFRCKFNNFSFRHCCLRCRTPKYVSDSIRIQRHGIPWLCRFCNLENWGRNHKCFKCKQRKSFAMWRNPRWRVPYQKHWYQQELGDCHDKKDWRSPREKCHLLSVQKLEKVTREIRKIEPMVSDIDLDSSISSSEEDPIELEYVAGQELPTENEESLNIEKPELRFIESSEAPEFISNSQADLIDLFSEDLEPQKIPAQLKSTDLGSQLILDVTDSCMEDTAPAGEDTLSTGILEFSPTMASRSETMDGSEVNKGVSESARSFKLQLGFLSRKMRRKLRKHRE